MNDLTDFLEFVRKNTKDLSHVIDCAAISSPETNPDYRNFLVNKLKSIYLDTYETEQKAKEFDALFMLED